MRVKRSIAALAVAGTMAFGVAPVATGAGQHWNHAQCRKYKRLASAVGIPKHLIRKTLRQHGCLKHHKHH